MILGGDSVIHKMGLQKHYFDAVKNKIKKVEVRLNDEKRQTIKVGDIILFLEEPNRILENGIYVVVKDLKYYSDFNEIEIMYKKEIKYKDKIKCLYKCENNEHIVVIKSEDLKTLHAIVKFS